MALLDAFLARRTLMQFCAAAPAGGAEHRAASAAITALDGLAEALTGDGTLWQPTVHREGP
jgi:hypothetical protein